MKRLLVALALFVAAPAYAGSKVALIYGTESGAMRRMLVPNNDADLAKPTLLDPGESMLVVDKSVMQATIDEMTKGDSGAAAFVPYKLLQDHTGKDPFPKPAAVVRGGVVEKLLMADPRLDAAPAGTEMVEAFDTVKVGDAYDKATDRFIAQPETIVLPAGSRDIDGNVRQTDQVIVVPGGPRTKPAAARVIGR